MSQVEEALLRPPSSPSSTLSSPPPSSSLSPSPSSAGTPSIVETIAQLSPRLARTAKDNMQTARLELLEGQVFQPRQNQLLRNWLEDGRRYSDGATIEVENYEIHPKNNLAWLSDRAFSIIRHIIFVFKIPTRRFGSLMQCFAVLLLGKVLELAKFPDRRSLNRRLLSLSILD